MGVGHGAHLGTRYGTTPAEHRAGETIDQRLVQEEPDPALTVDLVARDVGVDHGAASAEEAAMHVIDESEADRALARDAAERRGS